MWQSKLKFISPGIQTLILDRGRIGHQAQGVPHGGFLDTTAAIVANKLVNNDDYHPILEVTLTGPKIEVTGDVYIAITGGNINFTINGSSAKMYETIHVKSGSIITLGSVKSGARSYLAIGGDWQVNKWLRSTSPIPKIKIKDIEKNKITKQSILKINVKKLITKKVCPPHLKYREFENNIIRVTKGPEFDSLNDHEKNYFLNETFNIHQNSNRMAISFEESIPDYLTNVEMISSAVLPGTIQITNQGKPMILQNDAGTTGGYPRIANVITKDLPKVAQLSSGQKVNFELVTLEIAYKALQKEKEMLLSFS